MNIPCFFLILTSSLHEQKYEKKRCPRVAVDLSNSDTYQNCSIYVLVRSIIAAYEVQFWNVPELEFLLRTNIKVVKYKFH